MADLPKKPGPGGGKAPSGRVKPPLSRRAAPARPGTIPDDVPVAEASPPLATPPSPLPISGRAPAAGLEPPSVDPAAPAPAAEAGEAAVSETPSQVVRRGGKRPSGKSPRGPSGASRRMHAAGAEGEETGGHEKPRFRKGVPLGVKIAALSAALVVIVAVGLGLFLVTVASETVEKQINQKGVVAVSELASFADPIFWFPPTQMSNEPDNGWDRRWQQEKAKRVKEWQAKLEKLVRDKDTDVFLNAVITNDSAARGDVLIAASSAGAQPSIAATAIGTAGEVAIFEGTYAGADWSGRVRRYTRPIYVAAFPRYDKNDPLISDAQLAELAKQKLEPELKGFAHFLLKADEIDHVKAAIFQKVGIAAGAGILVAIVLSIAVAAFLSSPLRALVSDMRIVASGDLSHKTVPRSRDEIGQVAAQFNEMTRSLRAAQKNEQERQAIEHELQIATEIQTKLLPDRIPQIPGYDLYSFYLSAKEVGGDYYDFLVIDPTHLGIIVADVSGKGIPGSMVMTMVRSLIRLASHRETSPAETLKKVNRILAKDIRRGMFVTAIYAVLDVQKRLLTVSSAGHNPMVYFCARTGEARQVNPPGIALGFDKGRTFDENIKEEAIQLEPGDRVALYTDGVVEAMNHGSEEFGMERFMKIFAENAKASSKELTNLVVQALEQHRGKAEQSDDITITTLKVE